MKDLFLGQGVAHTIMLLAFVIGIGIYLGRFKIKGVSIGATWILFTGILVSHFGFRANPEMPGIAIIKRALEEPLRQIVETPASKVRSWSTR